MILLHIISDTNVFKRLHFTEIIAYPFKIKNILLLGKFTNDHLHSPFELGG